MKKIILIIPPQEKFSKDYLPSIGVGYLAASLEKAGYAVMIIDSHVDNLNDQETAEAVLQENPDAVGITANSHNRFHAIAVAREIKNGNERILVCVGGCHFSSTAVSALKTVPQIDIVVRGEGEEAFVDLLSHYFGQKPLDDVLGITFRKDGEIIENPSKPFVKDLDSLPMPAWHLFKLDKYEAKLEGGGNIRAIGVKNSRGCPYSCSFCVNSDFWQRLFRYHSPKRFVDEVEFLYKKYGYRGFDFWDDTITAIRDYISEVCREILRRKLDIVWYARARVNTVDKELLTLMKEAGCRVISFGVESGSPRILKNIQKDITIEQVRQAVKTCVELGYIVKLFFMYSHPGETLKDIKMTRDLMRELKFYGPNVHVLPAYTFIYPGTETEVIAKKEGLLPADFNWNSPVEFSFNKKIKVNPTIPIYEQENLKAEEIHSYLHSPVTQFNELLRSVPLALKGIRNAGDFAYLSKRTVRYLKKKI
jgi:radical SAM superfamily enzyme YgiQ (UPF0313 family)